MIFHYLLDYGAFLLGCLLYILSKVQEFKEMAEANPDPNVNWSYKKMFQKEWINVTRLLIGGIALVIFLPMLVGGATVDFKNESGTVLFTLALKTVLIPLYFFIGYGGNAALFALFGKYKKTLLAGFGGGDPPSGKP